MDTLETTLSGAAENWLTDFGAALSAGDAAALEALFHPDSHWRDLLAYTWHISTVSGPGNIAKSLAARAAGFRPQAFRLNLDAAPPRMVMRGGREDVLEAIFSFTTSVGPCSGVFRMIADEADSGRLKVWTILTTLDEMTGFEETTGKARPTGEAYSRDFAGPNWLDRRNITAAYEDRDPDVLVVGGGQAGLSVAARLTQLGVDTLIVDKEERVGDNWRKRYHALVLHNQVHVNHLPYMPFPPNWPTYIPKDKLAGWFEYYAEAMELNFWTETEFNGGTYDDDGRWTVDLIQPGGNRTMRPRHVVMATSVTGIPNLPTIPTLDRFGGEVIHSSAYTGATARKDKRVLIIGTGTSAHDMAQDLQSNGATVSLIQRGTTSVINVEPSAQLPYTLYDEGLSLETADLIATATPYEPLKAAHTAMADESTRIDKDMLDALENVGFRIDHEDKTGWQFKFMNRGGGYYFNVGCSDLIIDGKVGLIQYDDIESFVADGAKMKNGDIVAADTVILATGFKGQEAQIERLLGVEVAERVGPIWGFGDDSQELRNMWMRTGQPGLWFIAGSFAQCRIFSKYLALQIKACQEGMIEPVKPAGLT